jgi:hypothetical protein
MDNPNGIYVNMILLILYSYGVDVLFLLFTREPSPDLSVFRYVFRNVAFFTLIF